MVKRLPAMLETWVPSLGWEDPLEQEMATHSSTLAWKIPWTEEPGRLQSMGPLRVGQDRATSFSLRAVDYWLDCSLPFGLSLLSPGHLYLLLPSSLFYLTLCEVAFPNQTH